MSIFKGSGVALVTPFNNEGVDFKKLEELIEWHISSGTSSLLICGTTGEATTMTEEERKTTIKFVVEKANKRIPIIAGTGSNNTAAAISMSKWAESIGVDAILVITPYYNKTTQKGLVKHFEAISNSVTVPIILYNVPSRTGVNINPETLAGLCKFKNIVAIKEASGNLSQIAKIKALYRDRFDIYSGNDDQVIPILSLGGAGVISVTANILPKQISDMCTLYMEGKVNEALQIQLDTLNLTNALFIETNPIPIKTAMNLLGNNVGNLRLPLCDMEEKNLDVLKKELLNFGLTIKED